MFSFQSLPTPRTVDKCNPLSLRILNKKYISNNNEIIDGGKVECEKIDHDLNIKPKDKNADWLIIKDSIFYIHPQTLTIKEFSFDQWSINSHLGNFVKKRKGFNCIRIYKILNERSRFEYEREANEYWDKSLFFDSLANETVVDFYDFYVENGKELNISIIFSTFLDKRGYK